MCSEVLNLENKSLKVNVCKYLYMMNFENAGCIGSPVTFMPLELTDTSWYSASFSEETGVETLHQRSSLLLGSLCPFLIASLLFSAPLWLHFFLKTLNSSGINLGPFFLSVYILKGDFTLLPPTPRALTPI